METKEILSMRSPAFTRVTEMRKPGWPPLRPLSGVLPDRAWAGRRCFIIGGGPSLRGFDFNRLRGELVLSVNRAFEFCPFAELNFAMDIDFYGALRRGQFNPAWSEFKGLKVWLDLVAYPFGDDILTVPALGEHGVPWSLKDGIFHGSNSGYAALQVALLLGAAPIYLLGYDMRFDAGQVHFYPSPPVPPEAVYRGFAPGLDALAVRLPHGLVVNLSPISELKGFERAHVDDVLGRA